MITKYELCDIRKKRIKAINTILPQLEELRGTYSNVYENEEVTRAIVSLETQLSHEITEAYKLGILKFMEE